MTKTFTLAVYVITVLALLATPVSGAEVWYDVFVQDTNDLAGAQVGITYDTTVLDYVRVEQGEFLSTGGAQLFVEPIADGSVLSEVIIVQLSTSQGVTGSGWLFRIVFETANTSITPPVDIDSSLLSDSQGLVTTGSVNGAITSETPTTSTPTSMPTPTNSAPTSTPVSSGGGSAPTIAPTTIENDVASTTSTTTTQSTPETRGLILFAALLGVVFLVTFVVVKSRGD
jgi:hypothetical protein